MRLFFGCSSKDKEFVDSLMSYLLKVYEIELEQMYNCYVGINKIQAGTDYNEFIKQAIIDCDRAIIVISPESLKRKYCLCELGAAWGLGKNIIQIVIAPCQYSDLLESPLMGTQAWSVNLSDPNSISNFVECINADRGFAGLKRSINHMQKRIAENEFKDSLISLGQLSVAIPPSPDMNKCSPFHSDGNANTLRITSNEKSRVKVRIDFSTSKPSFVGFYVDLKDVDWTGLLANDYSISMNLEALATIRGVRIEFKNKYPGRELAKIGERYIDLTKPSRDEAFSISDISDTLDDWRHMKELTFVFDSSDIEEMGTFTVSNIRFDSPNSSRSN